MLSRDVILEKIKNGKDLPAFPDIIDRLQRESFKANVSLTGIAQIIKQDMSLAAVFLKTANSAYYATATPATDVVQAVSRLGLVEVRRISCAAAITARFGKLGGQNPKKFWQHCLTVSMTSQILAEVAKMPLAPLELDSSYTAGLLHDLGVLAFAQVFQQQHAELAQQIKNVRDFSHKVEMEVLGIEHGEIGAVLANHWKLPPLLCDVIRYHHEPWNAPAEHRRLTWLTHLANMIANNQKLNREEEVVTPTLESPAWKELGLTKEDAPTVLNIIRLRSKRVDGLLGG